MAEDIKEEVEQKESEKAEKTFTEAEVNEILSNKANELLADFQSQAHQNLSSLLSTPEGQQQFASHYGLKLADVKAAVKEQEEDIDPIERELKELRAKTEMQDKLLAEQNERLSDTSIDVKAEKIAKEYDRAFEEFCEEYPEAKSSPKVYAALRGDVFGAMESDPRIGDPKNVKKLAKAWMERQEELAPLISNSKRTSSRGGRGGGAVPEGKKPEEMTDAEAREAIFRHVINA